MNSERWGHEGEELVFGKGHGGVVEEDGEDEEDGVVGGEEGGFRDVIGDVGLVNGAEDGFAPDVVGDEGVGGGEEGLKVGAAVVGVFGEERQRACVCVEPLQKRFLGEVGELGIVGARVELGETWGEGEGLCGHGVLPGR